MHILFVDDTFETRDLYRLCFTLDGHIADTAHNGLEALHIIQQKAQTLDVVILDYHMPQLNGLEVVRELRKIEDFPPIPIILFTGDRKENFEAEAAELGVARVIQKPVLPADLIAAAKALVENA